jgi:CTP:molybdopterin cytidylyltransferase MocA
MYKGVHGHPIWLSWAFVEREVLPAAPGARLDALIGQRTAYVQVEDASVTMNLNTPEDVQAWERASPATPGDSHR